MAFMICSASMDRHSRPMPETSSFMSSPVSPPVRPQITQADLLVHAQVHDSASDRSVIHTLKERGHLSS